MSEDQQDVVAFLGDPSPYGPGVDRVEVIETHASFVFIAGDRVFKLKRAVRYPYLDFSTADLRRRACEAELVLNRRTAPALYEEVRGLFRGADGAVSFAPNGEALDWVVVMRRFDQDLLFDALAEKGGLDRHIMDQLADHIAKFHASAERRFDHGGSAEMAGLAEVQYRCLAAQSRGGFSSHRVESILKKWHEPVAVLAELLDRRREAGKVRHCHGDLHLRNICLLDGKPTLFDCLEFDEALASIDVLYDLAFLLMDLEHRGLGHFANRVFNRYLDRSGEDDGLAAVPFFLSLRAAIRAHVTATSLEHAAGVAASAKMACDAGRYLDLAERFLQPQPCRLVAIGGLSGSGKSTLAEGLAPELGLRPGARVLRSDVTRKLLLGVDPEERLPATAYTREISARVYDALRRKAATGLAAGYTVVIDAVALKAAERNSFAEVARAAAVPFSGLWLEARPEAMADRIRGRVRDASDASPEILTEQLRHETGEIDWVRIDAGGLAEHCLANALHALAAG
ncbi:MAG TPA: AAA family ATPase [Stellaceae bacterium]|nr:AAA family ATPase [Stellaceae bacterium]